MHHKCTSLYCIVHLGSMEAQSRHVSGIQDGFAIHFEPKCMCCVIDDLQSILVCHLLDTFDVTWLSIAVYRHDGSRISGYCRFYLLRIQVASPGIDIRKYGLQSVPPD